MQKRGFIPKMGVWAVLTALGTCLNLSPVYAQSTKIDSLITVARKANGKESVRAALRLSHLLRSENLGQALDWSNHALSLSLQLKDEKAEADSRQEIARILSTLGRYELAMEHALASLKAYQARKDTLQSANIYSVIGGIYGSLDNHKLALESYSEAENLNRKINYTRGVVAARHNKCTVYSKIGQQDQAVRIYLENLAILDTLDEPTYLAATTNNLGNIYKDKGQYATAEKYLRMAYDIKKQKADKYGLINTCNNLGENFLNKGDLVQARIFLEEAKTYCETTGANDRLVENLVLWSRLEEKRGKYREALELRKQADALSDSVDLKNQSERVAQMDLAYKTEKKQAEIDFLNKQKKSEEEYFIRQKKASDDYLSRQRIFIILLSIGLLGVMFLFILQISNQGKIKRQKDEIQSTNTELKSKNDLLEEINREKDGLIGIVAHDLRAPLNRSAALAQLVTATGELNPEQLKYCNMIMKVAEDGSQLIQDLLEISSYQQEHLRTEFKPLRINEFLEGLLKGYYSQAGAKGQHIFFEPGADLEIQTDHQMLSRVLDNLISNAIKFSPPDKNIFISQSTENAYLVLTVRDEGPGLSPEDQKKLFRKFQRLSTRPTGGESSTGLGLAIVKILVDKLQGKVEVLSTPGNGCSFRVLLPRS